MSESYSESYESEDEDCLALRGYIIALVGQRAGTPFPGGDIMPLDVVHKKHDVVIRFTYAAELRNALHVCDDACPPWPHQEPTAHGLHHVDGATMVVYGGGRRRLS